jgi:hypothetical protein
MKYLLLFLLFYATVDSVTAETFLTNKEVECDKAERMISNLKNSDFKEVPIWFGKEADSKTPNYSLFVNPETRTWTIIQFNKDVACILGSGESYSVVTKKLTT